jgi:transcriptional regulator with GAF, ATPase, and Fis domain
MTLTKSQAGNLRRYDWPGNIRELKNVIERAVILSEGNVLRLDKSMPDVRSEVAPARPDEEATGRERPGILTESDLRELQKNNIIAALTQAGGRVSGKGGAAELLEIKPTTLADRIRAYDIRKPRRSLIDG